MRNWHEDAEIAWETLHWEGKLRWFASKMEGTRKRVMGGVLQSVGTLIGTVTNAEYLGWDLYLQLNPSDCTGAKASRQNILFWRYAVLDFDPDGTGLAPPNTNLSFDHHEIFSGRGYQYWLPIDEQDRDTDPAKAERLMNGWLHAFNREISTPGWKVDTACSDLARVVRCPGSVNQKTGKRAQYIMGRSGPMNRITAGFMKPYLRPEPEPVVKFEGGNGASLVDLLPHLNGAATTFLLYGVEEGKRHNSCYAACKNLREIGVSSYHAFGHLCAGGARCFRYAPEGEDYSPAVLPVAEVERIVQRVYQGGE